MGRSGRRSYARRLNVAVLIGVLLLVAAGCPKSGKDKSQDAAESAPCSFPGLVLVSDVVCIRTEPRIGADGSWSYDASNPKVRQLKAGSILVVAKKSVRQVTDVARDGKTVVLRTAMVPLTEVIADGSIPLQAAVAPGDVTRTVAVPTPAPPPRAAPASSGTPRPSPSSPHRSPSASPSQSPAPPGPALMTVGDLTGDTRYSGPCIGGQGPRFSADIQLSGGPGDVDYTWTRSDDGSTSSGTLHFTDAGTRTTMTVLNLPQPSPGSDSYYTPSVGSLTLTVTGPGDQTATRTADFTAYCLLDGSGTSDGLGSSSPSPSTAVVSSAPPAPRVRHAAYVAEQHWQAGGYDLQPSLTLGKDSFAVDLKAARTVGPATLTWTAHGELDAFHSTGALTVSHHRLQRSGLSTDGLKGSLSLGWSLDAAVPGAVTDRLAFEQTITLFERPLLVGDFPVVLTVEIQISAAPEFTGSASVLSGHATVSYDSNQGLKVHGRALDPTGAVTDSGVDLAPGVRDLLQLPSLKAEVKFPRIQVGDDFYSNSAFVWTDLGLDASLAAGGNPTPCAVAESGLTAASGVEFSLFGLRGGLSHTLFEHAFPAVSVPGRPECTAN